MVSRRMAKTKSIEVMGLPQGRMKEPRGGIVIISSSNWGMTILPLGAYPKATHTPLALLWKYSTLFITWHL